MSKEIREKISLSRKGRFTGAENPSWKGGLCSVQCAFCNNELTRHPSQILKNNFCNKTCFYKFIKEDNTFGKWNLGVVRTQEHKNKISLSKLGKMVGIKHPRWISDRNLLKQDDKKHLDSRYREWMLSVKKRDGFKCKINNNDCAGGLESHHILRWSEYPELRYDINNGITLCHFHHPRKKVDEQRLSLLFKDLIKTSK